MTHKEEILAIRIIPEKKYNPRNLSHKPNTNKITNKINPIDVYQLL
ncbi:TPA: hypothetical protein KAD62_003323 [Escherichia coli]|nr:hypothetical protein [Escherichia coli]